MIIKGVVPSIKEVLETTYNSNVKSRVGDYAGIFEFNVVDLISSTDGVGTKIKVACSSEPDWPDPGWPHNCIGQDLVNHCVNDILVYGATPMFFLNAFSYASDRALAHMESVVQGMAKAARAVDMPIISGETARIPGIICDDHGSEQGIYDVVGTIIGYTVKDHRITGEKVGRGDQLIAIASSGIHTNGFTTIRRVFCSSDSTDEAKKAWVNTEHADGGDIKHGISLRQAVMEPHRCYSELVSPMLITFPIHGIAHITGGGIEANLRRVVNGHKFEVLWDRWAWPHMFHMIQGYGGISAEAMKEEFNLGVGLILVVPDAESHYILSYLHAKGEDPKVIGEIVD